MGRAPVEARDDAATEPVDPVDEASNASFPASDAPPWGGVHLGPPRVDVAEDDARSRAVGP